MDIVSKLIKSSLNIGKKVSDAVFGTSFTSSDNFEKNANLQKEFAQKGLSWRVQDAINAGIHPLAALGANVTSFSPITTFDQNKFGNMGQSLKYLYDGRVRQEEKLMRLLQNEKIQAETELLKARKLEIEKGLVGQKIGVDEGTVEVPVQVPTSKSGLPGTMAGNIPAEQYYRSGDNMIPYPNEQLGEAGELPQGFVMNIIDQFRKYKEKQDAYIYDDEKWIKEFVKNAYPRGKNAELPKGYEWVFNVDANMWDKEPVGKYPEKMKAVWTGRQLRRVIRGAKKLFIKRR